MVNFVRFSFLQKMARIQCIFFCCSLSIASRNSFVYENYACPEMYLSLILFIDAVKLL